MMKKNAIAIALALTLGAASVAQASNGSDEYRGGFKIGPLRRGLGPCAAATLWPLAPALVLGDFAYAPRHRTWRHWY